MSAEHYTYRVSWSAEDGEYVATCAEFPSLSWLAEQQEEAFAGIRQLVHDTVADIGIGGTGPINRVVFRERPEHP
jgi:hypothetical protein